MEKDGILKENTILARLSNDVILAYVLKEEGAITPNYDSVYATLARCTPQ